MHLFFYDLSETHEQMSVFSSRMKYQTLADHLNCSVNDVNLHTNEHGKPFLPNQSVHFNISHTENLWVMAVHPNAPIGIDIERHKPRKNMDDMMKNYFYDDEYDAYMAMPTPSQKNYFFYDLWTKKEAYAKYIGLGMTYNFSRQSFIEQAPKDTNIATKTFIHPSVQWPLSFSIATEKEIDFDSITINNNHLFS